MNGGAESGNVEGWVGLKNMFPFGEPGLRRGVGCSGEYAFYWGGHSGLVRSDPVEVDIKKTYELTGWFKADLSAAAEGTGMVSVIFGLVPEDEVLKQAIAAGKLERNHKRGKWIGLLKKDVPHGEWVGFKFLIRPAQWWPGVDKVQVMISPERMGGALVLLLDDLALREVE